MCILLKNLLFLPQFFYCLWNCLWIDTKLICSLSLLLGTPEQQFFKKSLLTAFLSKSRHGCIRGSYIYRSEGWKTTINSGVCDEGYQQILSISVKTFKWTRWFNTKCSHDKTENQHFKKDPWVMQTKKMVKSLFLH